MYSSGKNWPGLILVGAGLFGIVSTLLAFANMIAQTGFAWFILAWGDLLFRSFHLAGLYMPVYLLICGWTIFQQKADVRLVLWLSLGFIPALFAGIAMRLMLSSDFAGSLAPAWMVANLTHQGAVIVAAALSLISLIVLLQAPSYFGPTTKPGEAKRTIPSPNPPHGRPSVRETAASTSHAAETVAAGSAIEEFSQAMEGKLESRLRPPSRPPVDLDEPLDSSELKEVWTENPDKLEAALGPHYVPRRPMFYDPQSPEAADEFEEDPAKLEIYFSKEGGISDYPPRGRHSFVTLADEDETEVETKGGTAADKTAGPLPSESPIHQKPEAPPVSDFSDQGDNDAEQVWEPDDDSEIDDINDDIDDTEDDRDQAAIVDSYHATVPDAKAVTNPPSTRDAPALAADDGAIDTSLLPPLEPPKPWERGGEYSVPIVGILDEPKNHQYWVIDDVTTRSAAILKQTLEEFGIAADVTGIRKGPVITMFEILPAPGVKLARIVNLSDNIALRLAAQSVRIVAPIPGKHAVGIEIPNKERAVVSFAELLMAEGFRAPKVEIPVALGKDISGDAQIVDLTKTPHLLIAGATGSGKSVCVNALICSILYRRSPAEVKMILIDPKIVELKFYNDIPHLLTPVITDPKKAFQALQWCLFEMERRYSLLDAMQVRDIKSYNRKIKVRNIATPHLPYLVVVIDEFADLMATSGKELEGTLARLAAMSRAVGIHLVLATQRPSADVITGLIKANIPSRIAFMVASKIDSRIIIDGMGADKLLGKGDMLFTSAWDPFPFRMQGAFLSEEEVERIVSHVKTLGKPEYIDDEIFFDAEEDEINDDDIIDAADDPLLKEAIDIVVTAKKASASYLQRRLKIGYNRAARMVEQMEEMGIVGPAQGSKAREILRMYQ